jgi:imidazolonepropionase-like amidohydrolase
MRCTSFRLLFRRPAACHAVVLILALLVSACAASATTVEEPSGQANPAATGSPIPDAEPGRGASGAATITITGVAVVDVEQGLVLPGQTVVVAGERIVRIAPSGEVAPVSNSQVLDGRGLYLIPGLVDAHVHDYDPQVFGRLLLANGVVLVRDMGQPTELAMTLRSEANSGGVLGPEMIVTGAILDGDPPLIPQISLALRTPAEARAAVQQQAAAGVDEIKVYSNLDAELLQAIIAEAHGLGLKVVGHVAEAVYVEDAVAAGQDSIEHLHGFDKVIGKLLGAPITLKRGGMGVDFQYWPCLPEVDHARLEAVLRGLAASGVAVCPTVVVFKVGVNVQAAIAGELGRNEYISPLIRGIWQEMWGAQSDIPAVIWQSMAAFVRDLHVAGVTLMVGTDLLFPGIIPGFAVHEEMAIWQEAGIPPADVLRSATIVPARFMGLGERLGTLAEGRVASMVLLRANPLDDIENAQQIEGVFLRGQYFSRDDLDRLLVEARELAQQ